MISHAPVVADTNQKNYGFIIDNRKCIGCHACSTACKSENDVPLGVNRTWVKYVETGAFPNARRHFQVTRCNHCANPPCVRICPTEAMYQRHDGIVEFDNRVCIGCKACMQACPYDAIHIDPDSRTAAKCHYCAHRTEIGLEPACVVVCPEQAIIAGDINDPFSEISQILATENVTVRKPEQGTAPKLFYINGNDVVMHPTATERAPKTFMWADVVPLHAGASRQNGLGKRIQTGPRNYPALDAAGVAIRRPQTQGQPWQGPIQLGSTVAEHMVQVAYNAQHKIPWHWPVPAYLVTKGIGAGIFMLLTLGLALDWFTLTGPVAVVSGFLSLLFIGATTGLLVYDLERPERFVYILLRPQWKSWLARGAIFLIGFSAVVGVWWIVEFGALLNWWNTSENLRLVFLWVGFPPAVGVAIYTAFLFAQAEGRDLWQSPLLPFHLLIQSLMLGSAGLLNVSLFFENSEGVQLASRNALLVTLILDLFVTLVGEFSISHASDVAAQAARAISHGRFRYHFWWGSIGLGHILPLVLVIIASSAPVALGVAGLSTLIGIYAYEYAFVMAPQEIPNS